MEFKSSVQIKKYTYLWGHNEPPIISIRLTITWNFHDINECFTIFMVDWNCWMKSVVESNENKHTHHTAHTQHAHKHVQELAIEILLGTRKANLQRSHTDKNKM